MTSAGAGDMFSRVQFLLIANGAVLFFTGFLLLVVLFPPAWSASYVWLCVQLIARCFFDSTVQKFLGVLRCREVGFFALDHVVQQ